MALPPPLTGAGGAMNTVCFAACQVDGGSHHLRSLGNSPGRNVAGEVLQLHALGGGACWPRCSFRPTTPTRAPSRANASAMTCPIPEVAPVTRAVFPGKRIARSFCKWLGGFHDNRCYPRTPLVVTTTVLAHVFIVGASCWEGRCGEEGPPHARKALRHRFTLQGNSQRSRSMRPITIAVIC